MSVVPPPTPVTSPAALTVATPVFDDAHVAWDVTICVVLLDSVAVAVNCEVAPTFGDVPPTVSTVTVGAVDVAVDGVVVGDDELDDPPLHAHAISASETARADADRILRMEDTRQILWLWPL